MPRRWAGSPAQRPEYGADGPVLLREIGSKLADFILGFAELGWYAWGTATVAISLVKILALPEALTQPLMVLFGILFCVTALVGYKGLDALSRLSVPLMFVLLMVSMYLALHHAGGWQAMTRIAPSDTMTWSAAITMVFGTFASSARRQTGPGWLTPAGPPFSPAWAASSSATG